MRSWVGEVGRGGRLGDEVYGGDDAEDAGWGRLVCRVWKEWEERGGVQMRISSPPDSLDSSADEIGELLAQTCEKRSRPTARRTATKENGFGRYISLIGFYV